MNRGQREEETDRRRLVITKRKMDKGDVPGDYALILHGCLSVTMETVCVHMSRIGELRCVQDVCVMAPHCVSKRSSRVCDHTCVSVCLIQAERAERSYLFRSWTLGLMSDRRDGMKDRLMNA